MWQILREIFLKKVAFAEDISHEELKYSYNAQISRRRFDGVPKILLSTLLVIFSLFLVFLNITDKLSSTLSHCFFFSYVILLIFMLYPLKKQEDKPVNSIPWYDLLLALFGISALQRYVLDLEILESQSNLLNLHWNTQFFYGVIGMLALAEACRRVLGLSVVCLAGMFFLYAMTTERPATRIVYDIFTSEQGLLGGPAKVCVSYMVLFMIFSSFLEEIGLPEYFFSCAKALTGGKVGGLGKVAVLSSAFGGMMSGSSVGNTVTTGSHVIPLMEEKKYPKIFQGAVVASASVGGQLMPPIMGSTAFLMVEFYDIPYWSLVSSALLPAFLYFLGIYFMVHFSGKKYQLKAMDREPRENLLGKSYLLLPLIVLMTLMSLGFPVLDATFCGVLLCILISLKDKGNQGDFGFLFRALENASKMVLPVAVACAMAGIISGIVTSTGLSYYLISAVVSVAEEELFVALLVTMLFSLLLGTMVPTVVNYAIMSTIGVPILIYGMGVDVIAANIFVFYFAIVADITPPVSMASYAAAAISKGSYLYTALTATVLSLAGFIIPYLFVLYPPLLLRSDTVLEVLLLVLTASAGMFAIAAGVVGYMLSHLGWTLRCCYLLSGVLLIYPETYSDVVGLLLISLLIFQQKISQNISE